MPRRMLRPRRPAARETSAVPLPVKTGNRSSSPSIGASWKLHRTRECRYTIATGGHSSMTCRIGGFGLIAALFASVTACSNGGAPAAGLRYQLNGPLVPARLTMVTAWDFPKNPLEDRSLDDSKLSTEIKWGYEIFTNTPDQAKPFAPGKGSCNNCHLNGGQREKALPLVGVAGMFPEYNRRAGRLISLGDRVVDCFLRSQNATGRLAAEPEGQLLAAPSALPSP